MRWVPPEPLSGFQRPIAHATNDGTQRTLRLCDDAAHHEHRVPVEHIDGGLHQRTFEGGAERAIERANDAKRAAGRHRHPKAGAHHTYSEATRCKGAVGSGRADNRHGLINRASLASQRTAPSSDHPRPPRKRASVLLPLTHQMQSPRMTGHSAARGRERGKGEREKEKKKQGCAWAGTMRGRGKKQRGITVRDEQRL